MAMRAEQKVCWDCSSLSPAARFRSLLLLAAV